MNGTAAATDDAQTLRGSNRPAPIWTRDGLPLPPPPVPLAGQGGTRNGERRIETGDPPDVMLWGEEPAAKGY